MRERASATALTAARVRAHVVRHAFGAGRADLAGTVAALGFVQADPIRAPARAQDLTLRHRVRGYRAGDLERRYPSLPIEEDVFVNYGFVTQDLHRLRAVLAFVRERGSVHPREVDEHFAHGRVTNYWGGSSNATTHLLDLMHYRGLLRVVRRDAGVRVYAIQDAAFTPIDRKEREAKLYENGVHG